MGKKYIKKNPRSSQGGNKQKKIVKIKDRFNPDFNTGFLPLLSNSETRKNSDSSIIEKHCFIFNVTFCNMINKYFQLPLCPYKSNPEYIQIFYRTIKQLSLDINEFVGWTLLIDQYIKENSKGCDSKHLLYLAICSKINLLNYSEIINEYKNNEDFQIWYNLNKKIIEKGINLIEFNKRYNDLRNNRKSLKIIKYNDFVNDLCKKFDKKNKKIDENSNFLLSSNIINKNSSENSEINIEIENINNVNYVNNDSINIKSSQKEKINTYKISNNLDFIKNCSSNLIESKSNSILSLKNESEENYSYYKENIEGLSHNSLEKDDEKIDENKSFNMGEIPTYLNYYNLNQNSFESLLT